eukprot:scaffold62175_cov17-Tisochrysis_lutea.AAC.2
MSSNKKSRAATFQARPWNASTHDPPLCISWLQGLSAILKRHSLLSLGMAKAFLVISRMTMPGPVSKQRTNKTRALRLDFATAGQPSCAVAAAHLLTVPSCFETAVVMLNLNLSYAAQIR